MCGLASWVGARIEIIAVMLSKGTRKGKGPEHLLTFNSEWDESFQTFKRKLVEDLEGTRGRGCRKASELNEYLLGGSFHIRLLVIAKIQPGWPISDKFPTVPY